MPRPIGDFAELGAVVSTKVNGLPLQSIIMKAALLPDNGNHHLLESAARQAGEWLQQFHKATAGMPARGRWRSSDGGVGEAMRQSTEGRTSRRID